MHMKCKPSCGKFILLAIVGVAALGWVVMALWNWLAPILCVGGKTITYMQAMGLLVLSKILFGGFRCHGRWHGRCHQRKLDQMSPEEREKFRTGLLGCCGSHKQDDSTSKDQCC